MLPDDLVQRSEALERADRDAGWEACDRANRHTPLSEMFGRPVSPAVVQLQAERAITLRERLDALAPQDPRGVADGESW